MCMDMYICRNLPVILSERCGLVEVTVTDEEGDEEEIQFDFFSFR